MPTKTNPKAQAQVVTNPFAAPSGYQFDGADIPYANKDEYTDKALKFRILGIDFESGLGYKGADRWAVVVRNERQETEVLTFSCNETRDERMNEAQTAIEAGQDLGLLVLVSLGKEPNKFHVINVAK